MAFDRALRPEEVDDDPPRLLAIFGIHVDDLLGCCNEQDPANKKLMDKLRGIFCFREWHSGAERDELSHCGAKITKIDNFHWKIHHSEYFKKQKPISIQKDRLQSPLPVTNGERTALCALLGALQWPSTQTAPWLQAAVSLLAGNVTNATTTTLQEANKVLRYAKENNDVGLEYRPLRASKDDITFIAFSDASFACRSDVSSQGGYLVAMVDKTVAKGAQGNYNVLDWRSWKLARVSRSTLAAESQAASEAADSLLFTTTFWKLIWRPWLPLDNPNTPKMKEEPHLIVDAKALYDLLSIPEFQANSGSDKRTTIEVLVTRDKLACSGSTTRWASSEQQYVDGLTKQSAAQLLADRFRSHMVKLKSDTTFKAAKKKSPQERKRTAEMFAVKRPGRAMMAMFAVCLNACTAAMKTSEPPSTTNYHYIDLNLDITVLLFTAILAFVMGNFLMYGIKPMSWTFWRPSLDGLVEEENLKEASMPPGRSIGVETELHMAHIMDVADRIREVNRMDEPCGARHPRHGDRELPPGDPTLSPSSERGRCHAEKMAAASASESRLFAVS